MSNGCQRSLDTYASIYYTNTIISNTGSELLFLLATGESTSGSLRCFTTDNYDLMQAARCHLGNSHKTQHITRSVRRNQPYSRPRSRRSGGCARRSPTRGRSRSGSGAAPLPSARLRPSGAAGKGGRAPSAASRHGGPGRRGAAGERQPPHLPPLRGAARDGEGGGRRAARLHRRPGDLRYPDGKAGAGRGRAGCRTGGLGQGQGQG